MLASDAETAEFPSMAKRASGMEHFHWPRRLEKDHRQHKSLLVRGGILGLESIEPPKRVLKPPDNKLIRPCRFIILLLVAAV